MSRSRRSPWARIAELGAAVLMVGALVLSSRADEATDQLIRQQEQQKQIQADTDRMVRQMESIVKLLQFNDLDKGQEAELLGEAVKTLGKLSANQMKDVIARLDAAAKAPDDKTANSEKQKAYERHREIVAQLKDLLAKRDALTSLEQAAERLDKASKLQLDLHLSTSEVVREMSNPNLPPGRPRLGIGFGGGRGRRVSP